jgi:hypothetical protein
VTVVRVRLQGGPFDGERLAGREWDAPPEILWVERCPAHGVEASAAYGPRCEKYRRDELVDGFHVYVWTDPRLQGRPYVTEREFVGVGAGAGEQAA